MVFKYWSSILGKILSICGTTVPKPCVAKPIRKKNIPHFKAGTMDFN